MLLLSTQIMMLASLCIISIGCCPAKRSEAYEKVHALLKEKGLNQEPTVYLDAVDVKLEELRKEKKSKEGQAQKGLADFIIALEKVAAYRLVVDNIACDLAEFDVLDSIVENSRTCGYITDAKAGKLSGLDYLVHTVALNHAKYCQDKYPNLFETIYSQLDKDLKVQAEFKFHRFGEIEKTKSTKKFAEYLIDYKYDSDSQTASDASNHLLELSKDDKNKCHFELIYRKYLIEPCQEYYSQLKQVIVPMKYDAMFFKDKSFYNTEDKSMLNLYRAMAHSSACSNILILGDLERKVRSKWNENNSKDCGLGLAERYKQKQMAEKRHRSLFDLISGR